MLESGIFSGPALRGSLLAIRASLKFERFARLFSKYSPDQPRIPGGQPGAGQFTFGNGEQEQEKPERQQFAQHVPRTPRAGRNARWPDATPGQQARLAASRFEADAATARIAEVDTKWRAAPGLYENIEGEILYNQSVVRQAADRLRDLQGAKALPGRFAAESLPAPENGRPPSAAERREINRIGSETGCHTCGTKNPGTKLGNFVADHQGVTALRGLAPQRIFPQCLPCSLSQGGSVWQLLRRTR